MMKKSTTLLRIACIATLLTAGSADAAADSAVKQTLPGEQLELTRTIARHLFAVQREERAAAEQAPVTLLLRELEGLREALRPVPRLRTGNGIGKGGNARSTAQGSVNSFEAAEVREAAPAREREEICARSARVRAAARDLEAGIQALRTPRLRAVARQAVKRARLLADQAEAAADLSPVENRAKRAALYQRLGRGSRLPAAYTPAPADETPNFTTITRHRRSAPAAQ